MPCRWLPFRRDDTTDDPTNAYNVILRLAGYIGHEYGGVALDFLRLS